MDSLEKRIQSLAERVGGEDHTIISHDQKKIDILSVQVEKSSCEALVSQVEQLHDSLDELFASSPSLHLVSSSSWFTFLDEKSSAQTLCAQAAEIDANANGLRQKEEELRKTHALIKHIGVDRSSLKELFHLQKKMRGLEPLIYQKAIQVQQRHERLICLLKAYHAFTQKLNLAFMHWNRLLDLKIQEKEANIKKMKPSSSVEKDLERHDPSLFSMDEEAVVSASAAAVAASPRARRRAADAQEMSSP